jgi:hypothetical protein
MHRFVPWLATVALALLLAACQAPRADGTLAATVGLDPDVCATESTLTLDASEAPHTVYLCYTITNTGDRGIGTHDLSDDANGEILSGFAYSLGAGMSVDTVAAGEVLAVEVDADTTFTASWEGFVGSTRVASAEASAQVVYEAPLAYAAVVGTFAADSNADTVAAFAGNVVVLGVRTLEGESVAEPVAVTITPPGRPAFDYEFDPIFANEGVVVLFWEDFGDGLGFASARLQAAGFATDVATEGAAIGTAAALEGDWTFAFPGATLVRAADPTDTVEVPVVAAADASPDGTTLSVAFAVDADPSTTYELEAYGRGDAAVFGFASGTASPVDVVLSGALEADEEVGVDVFAIRGALDPDAVFADGARFDLAEYLYVGPTTED